MDDGLIPPPKEGSLRLADSDQQFRAEIARALWYQGKVELTEDGMIPITDAVEQMMPEEFRKAALPEKTHPLAEPSTKQQWSLLLIGAIVFAALLILLIGRKKSKSS